MTMTPIHVTRALTPQRTFFELMRRVEALQRASQRASQRALQRKTKPSLHAERRPVRRPSWLRIEQSAGMHFASAEVARVQIDMPQFASPGEPGDLPHVTVIQRHFGLFAPYGPLPLHVTEHAMQEKRFERNAAFERFVNVACGDLAWLHYAAWSAMHPVLGYERRRNPFAERVTSLAYARSAVHDDVQRNAQDNAQDNARDPHALACRAAFPGIYCAPRRSLADLQRMLCGYFGVALHVAPRYGRWIAVPPAADGARRLGAWRMGARIWDVQHSLEIVIGPIEADAFYHWQRRAAAVAALFAVVADFVDGRLYPVIKVQVRTRPELAGRVGCMRVGVDAWCRPNNALRTLTVYESFRNPT